MKIETFEKARPIVFQIKSHQDTLAHLEDTEKASDFDIRIRKHSCGDTFLTSGYSSIEFDKKLVQQTRLEVIRKYKNEIARLQRELSKIK